MRRMRIHARDFPTRLATGAYILHSGWEKWHGTEEQAQGVHGMAAGAYPFLASVPPRTFLKALALAEIGLGATLLTPVVPNRARRGGAVGVRRGARDDVPANSHAAQAAQRLAHTGGHRSQQGRLDARASASASSPTGGGESDP